MQCQEHVQGLSLADKEPKAPANFLRALIAIPYHVQCQTKEVDLVYSSTKKFLEEPKSILLLFKYIFTPDMHGFYHSQPAKMNLFDKFKKFEGVRSPQLRWDLIGGSDCPGSRSKQVQAGSPILRAARAITAQLPRICRECEDIWRCEGTS